jgi:hypothetical protein
MNGRVRIGYGSDEELLPRLIPERKPNAIRAAWDAAKAKLRQLACGSNRAT